MVKGSSLGWQDVPFRSCALQLWACIKKEHEERERRQWKPNKHQLNYESREGKTVFIVKEEHKLPIFRQPTNSAKASRPKTESGPSTVTTLSQIEHSPSTRVSCKQTDSNKQKEFSVHSFRHRRYPTDSAQKKCENSIRKYCDHRIFILEYSDDLDPENNNSLLDWTPESLSPIDFTTLGESPGTSSNASPVPNDKDALNLKTVTGFKGLHTVRYSPYRHALLLSNPVSTGAIKENAYNPKINIIVNPVPSPAPGSPIVYPKPRLVFNFDDYEAYPPVPAKPLIVNENFDYIGEDKYIKTEDKNNKGKQLMGRMNPLEDHERKVIIEFCHLLEKSKQLFNGLRELPQYGHQQWHSYFGRTFDVYTKLWKFQQQHRAILDSKYGLKRWQIGEIASKIGQLYYHFYLRTSETAYLTEAFSFYYAIRGRCYYTKASKEDKCELMVKKLRYYARFIVVCLLLKKIKLVKELTKELDRQIVEYGNTYDPDDQIEWTVVVDEVKAFIQADPVVSVVHPDNYPVVLSHRLTGLNLPPMERSSSMLCLQEALIIGSTSQQVRFSELTIDMYRMLQSLEREPSENPQRFDDSPRHRSFMPTPSAPIHKGYNLENGPRRHNPHKYLLYKPSPMQMLVYLSSACQDLPVNGALLLYISADGQGVHQGKHADDVGYDTGGLITTSNDAYRESRNSESKAGSVTKHKEHKDLQCLHPGDLTPFTRRPLFIIIDSENSYVFQHVPRQFGQPLVILMSPMDLPQTYIADRKHQGSLFTLFLHAPLAAFCYISDIHNVSLVTWDRAMVYIDTFLAEASQLILRSRLDAMYVAFMGDDFLRLFILRFIFCETTLRLHRGFRTRTQLTRASPPLPDVYDHPTLVHVIMDLANHLQVRGQFHEPTAGPPQPKE